MGFSLLVNMLLAQGILAVIIVIVLKNILDNNLIESAIRRLEWWLRTEHSSSVNQVTVISHKKLHPKNEERIVKAAGEYFKDSGKPVFQIDRKIMGGVVIKVGENIFDYSLKDRLRLAFRGEDSA